MSVEGLLQVYTTDLEEEGRLTEKPSAVRNIYFTIGGLCNPFGYCFAKLEKIAKLSNCSRTTVIKLTKDLVDAGYIQRFERRRKHTRFRGAYGYKMTGKYIKPIPPNKSLEDMMDCDSFYELSENVTEDILTTEEISPLDVVEIYPPDVDEVRTSELEKANETIVGSSTTSEPESSTTSEPELKYNFTTQVKYGNYTVLNKNTGNVPLTTSMVSSPFTKEGEGAPKKLVQGQSKTTVKPPVIKDPTLIAGHFKGWAKKMLQIIGADPNNEYLLVHITTITNEPVLWQKMTSVAKDRKIQTTRFYAFTELMGNAIADLGIAVIVERFDYALRHANDSPFDYFETLIKTYNPNDIKPSRMRPVTSEANYSSSQTRPTTTSQHIYKPVGDEHLYLSEEGKLDLVAFRKLQEEKGLR